MKIEWLEYKWYMYDIYINKWDWWDDTNKFRVKWCGFLNDLKYFDTFNEAKIAAENKINYWINNEITDWYSEFENCMVWTWYEDCELDKRMVGDLLEKYKKQILLTK